MLEPVSGGMARADDGQGQAVPRQQLAFDEQEAGRVVNLAQQPRILPVRLGQDGDAMGAAKGELLIGVEFAAGIDDSAHELGPHARHFAQLAGRRRKDGLRRAEPLQQRPASSRPDARHQRQL